MTTTVTTSLAADIRREHEAAQQAFASAVEHAVRCGELLAEAKAQVRHGEWLPWLAEHFPASPRTAQGYMRLANHPDAQGVAHLGIEGALRHLAAPKGDLLDELQAMLPDLTGQDWTKFLESIDRFGVLVPVVTDHHGRVIDGRQRIRAAKQLGIEYRVDVVRVDPLEAAGICFSLNAYREHRRDSGVTP
ncbi:MAG: DUF3102 domain-containing protein [Candidatus Limnocylindria bacterium]